jgi:ankyrin repeat protein
MPRLRWKQRTKDKYENTNHNNRSCVVGGVWAECGYPTSCKRRKHRSCQTAYCNGTDVNAKDGYGLPPLHWPAWRGHKEIAELLIAKGADVNAKGLGDTTPLNSAIFARITETADLLRKHCGKTGEELKAEGK